MKLNELNEAITTRRMKYKPSATVFVAHIDPPNKEDGPHPDDHEIKKVRSADVMKAIDAFAMHDIPSSDQDDAITAAMYDIDPDIMFAVMMIAEAVSGPVDGFGPREYLEIGEAIDQPNYLMTVGKDHSGETLAIVANNLEIIKRIARQYGYDLDINSALTQKTYQ